MGLTLCWTQMPVQLIFWSAMSANFYSTKAANAPRDRLVPNPKGKLRDQFHEVARFQHLSLRTEESYWQWVMQYLKFHRDRAGAWLHPCDL